LGGGGGLIDDVTPLPQYHRELFSDNQYIANHQLSIPPEYLALFYAQGQGSTWEVTQSPPPSLAGFTLFGYFLNSTLL
jgi:hypothetical protein